MGEINQKEQKHCNKIFRNISFTNSCEYFNKKAYTLNFLLGISELKLNSEYIAVTNGSNHYSLQIPLAKVLSIQKGFTYHQKFIS